jgi:hypothetical protein
VAHTYNSSYSGGRDQDDHSSKPAEANRSPDTILKKNPSQKRDCGVAQNVGPEFKPWEWSRGGGGGRNDTRILVQETG